MTAGDKFNLCVNEFTESNNLKLQSETSSTDATVIPVIDDKINYIHTYSYGAMKYSCLLFLNSKQNYLFFKR